MPYPLTLAQAYTDLATRLYDPNNQFWSQPELLLYIQESIREFNALTGYWRGDFIFPSVINQTWYDLTVVPNTLRPLTLTTTDLATLIEYHLLEPAVGLGPWAGSAQFSTSALQSAIDRRREELLGATGCALTRSLQTAAPGRVTYPNTTLDVRRVAFLPAATFGPAYALWPDDTWSWGALEPNYTALPSGQPSTYALNTEPPFTFDVDRNLNVPGQYELLTVQSAADPSLGVPDDWTWLLKWGALAVLLGTESNAKDSLRAAYCADRYNSGLTLLAKAPALLQFRISNLPVQLDSVREADAYNPLWEAASPATPTSAYTAGLNLLALSPQPPDGTTSLTATVIRNAPVPSLPSDPLILSEDVYEAILNEAQHVAMFKSGGEEFSATVPLHQRFLGAAAIYAAKLAEMGEFAEAILAQSQREEQHAPRLAPGTLEKATANG